MDEKKLLLSLDELFRVIDEVTNTKEPVYGSKARKLYDVQHTIPKIEWFEGGHQYTAWYVTHSGSRYVSGYGQYTKDGVRTNIRTIKNSYRRIWTRLVKERKL